MQLESDYPYSQKAVVFCGGTGGHTVLRGLTKYNYPEKNYAIVGVWDSGGSSGDLRVADGVLPPGDYTQALLGMMESEKQYRAALQLRDRSKGHTLTNLIAARFEQAYHGVIGGIEGLRDLFAVRGHIIPVSTTDVDLCSETRNGASFAHEHEIDKAKDIPDFWAKDRIGRIWLSTRAEANPQALEAIQEAEKIIISPGSPYSSIFPHLLVEGIPEAIRSSSAKLIVVPNLMTTQGEDHHLDKFSEWLHVFQYYLGDRNFVAQMGKSRIDYALHNLDYLTGESAILYNNKRQIPVVVDREVCESIAPGIRIVSENLAFYDRYSHLFRHDHEKLAAAILGLEV